MRLKVVSFNLHKGYTPFKRRYELSTVRDLLRQVDCDLVFLQEMHGYHPESFPAEVSPLEVLADTTWPHFRYGVNSVYPSNFHGNAILSRFPIENWSNTDISTNPLERRGLLHGVIRPHKDLRLDLFCTHLNLSPAGQIKQLAQIQGLLAAKAEGGSCLFAGDFNDWSGLPGQWLKRGFGHLPPYPTFPSLWPLLPLDRMYYRGLQLRESRVLRDFAKLSDHLPLYAEFDFV